MTTPTLRRNCICFTSTLERSTNKLWGAHVGVPSQIAKRLISGNSRRVVCIFNDLNEHQCALLPHGEEKFVITVNKQLRAKLGLEFGMDVKVALRKDESVYGLPMPEELRELLKQDREVSTLFHALTRGRQRTLLYIVGSAKNPDARISQALVIVNHLKTNDGKINYKLLGKSLRDPRGRSKSDKTRSVRFKETH